MRKLRKSSNKKIHSKIYNDFFMNYRKIFFSDFEHKYRFWPWWVTGVDIDKGTGSGTGIFFKIIKYLFREFEYKYGYWVESTGTTYALVIKQIYIHLQGTYINHVYKLIQFRYHHLEKNKPYMIPGREPTARNFCFCESFMH